MATINASTMHSVKKKAPSVSATKVGGKKGAAKKGAAAARRGSVAPPLKQTMSAAAIQELVAKSPQDRKSAVLDIFRKVLGEQSVLNLSAPHAASTTRDRSGAAADLAVVAKELGVRFVLKECGVLDEMQRMLFPQGIETMFASTATKSDDENSTAGGGLKPSASALSLSSMDKQFEETTTVTSAGTDSKRGKTTPPNAREGCLLLIRGLCEIVGRKAEPYLVGAFLAAALDECSSSSSAVREAAEDSSTAICALAHPWAFSSIIYPLLLQSLLNNEWRVKAAALERLQQCSTTSPAQVHKLIPKLIPAITNQVWDTKAQVAKGSKAALLAVCGTNTNPDVKPTIPAVVNAICKPSDTNKAVSELMGTTFVVPVDASTLAILCPLLSRALKEKLAIHKRAACIVISNMSKLVETPEAVAPFGSLLVPELKKVSENVQFEEIRDEALKALANLTKALGDSYSAAEDSGQADVMQEERERVEAEQRQIEAERTAEAKREAETKKKEEEERRKFKEAMDAQRQLDILAAKEAEEKKKEEELKREKQKLSTKSAKGKCQGCGLKKCKKTCMFYPG